MKRSGREVEAVGGVRKWRKRCPECGCTFIAGRRATHCPPCRRAERGLFPGQKVPNGKLKTVRRARWRPKNARRYRLHACMDCGVTFRAGLRALRCVPCAERWMRKKWKWQQHAHPRRNRGKGSNQDRFDAAS